MDTSGAWKWIKTALLASLGGGIAGSVAALSDPAKYKFPQDLGTGKMWPFFLSGAGVTLGALLVKSPLGQKALTTFRAAQTQLETDREDFEKTKAEFTDRDNTKGKD